MTRTPCTAHLAAGQARYRWYLPMLDQFGDMRYWGTNRGISVP
ncbi:hypothetical protein [Gloeomargarita lithophora]|nr:hypothetical protein [Gloeomargarita lithophora]